MTTRHWLVALCLLLGAAAAHAGDARRVLVLYSNGRLVQANIEIEREISRVLAASSGKTVQILSEFLEFTDFPEASYEATLTTYLHDKYSQRRPDVVVAVARESLDFVLRDRAHLFPGVPIVHTGVFKSYLDKSPAMPADVVGVPVEYDAANTIEQALRWHPSARRLVIVTGSGSAARDREWVSELKALAPTFEQRVQVEFLTGLPMATIRSRVAALGSDSIVFTPGYYQGGANERFSPRESVESIAQASAAPVYGPLSSFLGTGAVGGRVPSFTEMGTQAAAIVGRLLDGASPATFKLAPVMPTRLTIDWRQAQRWGIADSQIPGDAVVQFRQPTFWETYRTAAIMIACIVLLQLALIFTLLLERRRRQKAEVAVQAQRNEIAHASRLAVAGELTASIAHEINQPLGAILASADAAEMILQAGGDRREDLIRIVSRIRRDDLRASDVIRRLRALLVSHEPLREPFGLAAIVTDVTTLLESEARRRQVSFEVRPMQLDSVVMGDPVQLQQVLINLILNAMDAVADSAVDQRVVIVEVTIAGGTVSVSVRDRGPGIALENLPKVFESFFSTKKKGMGLGLSIARTIVEAHGGRIKAENGAVNGAVFRVDLPSAKVPNRAWVGAA